MSKENSDKLVSLLRARLQSSGKAKSLNDEGNVVYVDVDIYGQDTLEKFIELSVSAFNQVPYFTFFTLDDDRFVELFAEVLVEGATLHALASQALLERGREFKIADGGIAFDPPNVAEMLNTQYCTLLSHHFEKLKVIKGKIQSFKN